MPAYQWVSGYKPMTAEVEVTIHVPPNVFEHFVEDAEEGAVRHEEAYEIPVGANTYVVIMPDI